MSTKYYGDLSKKRGMPDLWFKSQKEDILPNESPTEFRRKMLKIFKALPKRSRYSFWREQIRFNAKKKSNKKVCPITPRWIASNCENGFTVKARKKYKKFKQRKDGKCIGPAWLNGIQCGRVGIRKAKSLNLKRTKERRRIAFLQSESNRKTEEKDKRNFVKERWLEVIFAKNESAISTVSVWLKTMDTYLANFKTKNDIRRKITFLKKLVTKNKASFVNFDDNEVRKLALRDEKYIIARIGEYASSSEINSDMVEAKPTKFIKLMKEIGEEMTWHINSPTRRKIIIKRLVDKQGEITFEIPPRYEKWTPELTRNVERVLLGYRYPLKPSIYFSLANMYFVRGGSSKREDIVYALKRLRMLINTTPMAKTILSSSNTNKLSPKKQLELMHHYNYYLQTGGYLDDIKKNTSENWEREIGEMYDLYYVDD